MILLTNDNTIQPSTCFNIIKSRDNKLKLSVKIFVFVLHHPLIGCDLAARHALHDEIRSSLGLTLSNITHPKQKLTIQITDINSIKIYMNKFNFLNI